VVDSMRRELSSVLLRNPNSARRSVQAWAVRERKLAVKSRSQDATTLPRRQTSATICEIEIVLIMFQAHAAAWSRRPFAVLLPTLACFKI